ncbi:MAG: amino acid ABC transporter ATP-binding protein [Bariatricus sp.]
MISIRNLKKSFGSNTIFQNVNLDIEKGDAVVIVGGSGCGKSTLLRCINRLETPDTGQVLIDGEDILAPDANVEVIRRKLGMVYQSFNLFTHLNIMENMILAPMKVLGMSQKEAMSEAERLLEMVGMETRRFQMPSQLSGGQKQRVAIARAMAMKPEGLLFDEPTSALDPTMVDEVESVIRRLVENGMTSVIVTHDMRFAKKIASKVVFLAEKGIYEQGTPQQFFEQPSRELTRQFLYRTRMLERTMTRQTVDVYALSSEIRAFALPYGFNQRQSHGISFICDELILPIIRSYEDMQREITVRFVAGENGQEHTILVEFSALECNPLEHPAIDELNIKLLKGFTRELTSVRNGDGAWEVQAKL